MTTKTDIVIVGSGVAGLFAALNLPKDKKILIITKEDVEESDSFLAQGGICVLKNENDYDSYFEDTMKAGHYENRKESVDIMIRSSREIIDDLISYGVDFEKDKDHLAFTREGAHSTPRILFHEDITGKEITSKLLAAVQKLSNVTIEDHVTMIDIVCEEDHSNSTTPNTCYGIVCQNSDGSLRIIKANYTVMACGGVGGLYTHSTNYKHLTADALAISLKHGIELENIDYVQVHPTTLYSTKPGRRFLISESVRGEGALLYNAHMERFVNELLPRDLLTAEIEKQMKLDNTPYVWLSMVPVPVDEIKNHFPNIYKHCLEEGYDVTKDCIPVVPAQHYFMGGIHVNSVSKTSMNQLYAIGETSCNGVHGANRLASNSLLESLVFAKRAAKDMAENFKQTICLKQDVPVVDMKQYNDVDYLKNQYQKIVLDGMERMRKQHVK